MVQMVMNAIGFQPAPGMNNKTKGQAYNHARVAQQVRSPMLFQKVLGFAVISSSYVAIVAGLVHMMSR
jgi:hypothetical protein